MGRIRVGFRDQGAELGIGLGVCKVGGVGSGVGCSAVRTISLFRAYMAHNKDEWISEGVFKDTVAISY